MKRILIIILYCLWHNLLFAGDFQASFKVDSVAETAYFKILLSPEIISYAKRDYADIRLFNTKGEEIAYILKEEVPNNSTTGFKEYNLLENHYLESRKMTRVVVHNREKSTISSLFLVVRNSEIRKEITVKGSDDNRNWFIIQKEIPEKAGLYNETAELLVLNFPNSNYEYLELTTDDKHQGPIQILKAGYYDQRLIKGLFTSVPVKEIVQRDSSNKKSYISIRLNRCYEISKLDLNVSGPELYHRQAYLGIYRNYDRKPVFKTISEFELTSKSPSHWELEKLKTNEIVLIIENADNTPLKVEEIKVYQLNKYLVAKLEKGDSYFVMAGNEKLFKPDYDLQYFTDNISQTITTIYTSNVPELETTEKTSASDVKFTKTILWVVIILVIGLLGFLSVRMVKEMGRKE